MRRNSTATAPKLDAGRRITRIMLPSVDGMIYDRTTTLGVQLATSWGSEIELVHVSSSIASADPELEHLAEQVRTTHPDVAVRATHLHGDDPAVAIADHAEPGTLVLMATEHLDAWQIKNSVAERLLERIGGPVMLIGPNVTLSRLREQGINGEIVIGLDGSAAAETAIDTALELAGALDRRLWLARIMPDPDPDDGPHPEVAKRLQELADRSSVEVSTRWEVIQHNDPVDALERFAARRDAAVLVVSHRHRASPDRTSMASTTAGLVAESARPVLVVPAPHVPAVDAG